MVCWFGSTIRVRAIETLNSQTNSKPKKRDQNPQPFSNPHQPITQLPTPSQFPPRHPHPQSHPLTHSTIPTSIIMVTFIATVRTTHAHFFHLKCVKDELSFSPTKSHKSSRPSPFITLNLFHRVQSL